MVENDYLEQERSVHDKRSTRVKLTDKGLGLRKIIDEMFARHAAKFDDTDLDEDGFKDLNRHLKLLERFWERETQFTGLSSLDDE